MSKDNSITINKEVEIEVEVNYDYSISSDGVEVCIEDDSFTVPMEDIISEADEYTKREMIINLDTETIISAITDKFTQQENILNNSRARILELQHTNRALVEEVKRLKAMLSPAPEAIEALGDANANPQETKA